MARAEHFDAFERCRLELVAFATRLVTRHEIAEEIVQEAALRLLTLDELPAVESVRPWAFRVVSNLAIDHLRRHSTWREDALLQLRRTAEGDARFVTEARELRGSPEVAAIAREHLVACFSCTLRNLRPHQAASLLLKEVQELSTEETAIALEATPVQVKNWLQEARRELTARYATTCRLVAKGGVCHQCVELDAFFNGQQRDPLSGSARDLDARLAILRQSREGEHGPWHRRMFGLLDQVLAT
jgi:RNA polymerase sigma-70 factor (ECF subfamily)